MAFDYHSNSKIHTHTHRKEHDEAVRSYFLCSLCVALGSTIGSVCVCGFCCLSNILSFLLCISDMVFFLRLFWLSVSLFIHFGICDTKVVYDFWAYYHHWMKFPWSMWFWTICSIHWALAVHLSRYHCKKKTTNIQHSQWIRFIEISNFIYTFNFPNESHSLFIRSMGR